MKVTVSLSTVMTPVALKPYIQRFALAYVIASTAVGFMVTFLHIGSSASALAMLLASYVVTYLFVKKEKRAPTVAERWRLILGSLTSLWLITLTGLWIMFTFEPASGPLHQHLVTLPLKGMVVVFVLVSVISVFLLNLSYGWFARSMSRYFYPEK
ncbi:hypothetical protein C4K68_09895 [Pokkaliibacter plantistimulans]|uniref:Uncharacterized protein n=1 Tax=Proteobacteria bacterium 228 TaxID=2083153 RepID=A0A2S5KRM9_9PROT|nr:ABZJ_00895 family protein [Pokkaliibacter plantistimulans]PPC77504.1 hypothetical protein C4K68_09895 [Pokkaliibacter plantistimulans]